MLFVPCSTQNINNRNRLKIYIFIIPLPFEKRKKENEVKNHQQSRLRKDMRVVMVVMGSRTNKLPLIFFVYQEKRQQNNNIDGIGKDEYKNKSTQEFLYFLRPFSRHLISLFSSSSFCLFRDIGRQQTTMMFSKLYYVYEKKMCYFWKTQQKRYCMKNQ